MDELGLRIEGGAVGRLTIDRVAKRNALTRAMWEALPGLLAELEAETLGAESALSRIDEALALALQVDHRSDLAFLHRLRGEILLKRDPNNPASAEEAFQTALAVARQQGARSHGLKTALALAKLYQSTNRLVDAQAVLSPALEGFSPTPEMPEIAEARALMVAIEAGAHVRHE